MSSTTTIATQAQGSWKMLKAMVGIGVLCALLIVLAYEGTLPRVERLKEEALQKAIFKVLPGTENMQTYILDGDGLLKPINEKVENQVRLYAGYDAAGKLTGIAIPAAGQGYADVIRVLYGYDPVAQQVIGFHVLESKETPGLGDKIEKDDNFLANFKAMDVALNDSGDEKVNTIATVKSGTKQNAWEVDGITGATISSRAIADILDKSTDQWAPIIRQQIEVLQRGGGQ